jgi:hypothetical protein
VRHAPIQVKAAWNAGKGGRGSQAAKRELKAAYEDYMTHHAQDIKKSLPQAPSKGMFADDLTSGRSVTAVI